MTGRTRALVTGGLAVIVVFVAVVAVSLLRDHDEPQTPQQPAMASSVPPAEEPETESVPSDEAKPSGEASQESVEIIQPAPPTDLAISSGLTAKVIPYQPEGDVLDPPDMVNAYWVTERGTPGTASSDTVYVIGHTWRKGDAVFDALQHVQEGQEITLTVDGQQLRYRVDDTVRYLKNEVYDTDEVWRIVPGRLILISCFLRDDGQRSTENFVVYASLQGS